MTFSIAARCKDTGRYGVAVASSSPAVAARCAFARAGVGAVTSQNITDPALGPRLLDLMALGANASEAIGVVAATTEQVQYRQLTAVDAQGGSASFSGEHTLGVFGSANAGDVVCAGNLLSSDQIPQVMVDAFSSSRGCLVDRLLGAMLAAEAAGGEAGPVHSAGLLLVDKASWPVASLRIDWHEGGSPLTELESLWHVYAPQLNDYVTRAANPSSAPSYGVPGDQ